MSAKKSSPRLFQVSSPFVVRSDGGVRHHYLVDGRVYSEDDPAVKRCPGNFKLVAVQGVETATAAPAEVRAVTPPEPATEEPSDAD